MVTWQAVNILFNINHHDSYFFIAVHQLISAGPTSRELFVLVDMRTLGPYVNTQASRKQVLHILSVNEYFSVKNQPKMSCLHQSLQTMK